MAVLCNLGRHSCRGPSSRKMLAFLAAPMLALAFAGVTFAQSRPAGPPRPRDDDFPRDRGMPDRDVLDRPDRVERDIRRREDVGREASDLPSREVHGAVDANARTAFARANFHRLQDSLNSAIRQMQYNFEHSQEMMDALKAEKQAWDDYVAARNAALRPVVSDPKYQANVALKNEVGERIADVHAAYKDQKPTSATDRRAMELLCESKMKELVTLALVKLEYAQLATDMEVSALKNDSKVADARSKLIAAGTRAQAVRENFDRTVRNSQELASIRKSIEDARVAYITAEAYRDGAVDAANVALDYAYYKNRYNYHTYDGYPYDGIYGYGGIVRY